MLQDIDRHTSIPAVGTGLFPGTGPLMLWDTDVTRFEWRFLCQGCPWSRWRTLCHHCLPPLFAVLEATTTLYSAQGFLFASWLERLIDAQRALAEYTFLYLPSSFWFLRNAQSTGHVFASPNFWAMHPFHTGAWTRGRTGHLVIPVMWSERKTRTLLWKGKQICYVIVPSCPSWIFQRLFLRGLRANQLLLWKHKAFTWNSALPHLAASLPCCDWVTLWAGTVCTSTDSSSQDPAGNVKTSLAVPCVSANWGKEVRYLFFPFTASDPMTPHMDKCVMKAKMWGLLEQHKALPCWERKTEDKSTTSIAYFLWGRAVGCKQSGLKILCLL